MKDWGGAFVFEVGMFLRNVLNVSDGYGEPSLPVKHAS